MHNEHQYNIHLLNKLIFLAQQYPKLENDEELKDIENDLNQNEINNENQDIIPFEDNGKEILKENEPNDLNIEGEINIENNNIEKDNENNININIDKNSNKENDEQLKNMNEIFKNEITMLSTKKNNTNENMNPEINQKKTRRRKYRIKQQKPL